MSTNGTKPLTFALAGAEERETIYRMRHEVYARELHQHPEHADARLTDRLDEFNVYIVASAGDELAGFVSVTPPGGGAYSLDKYLARERLPFRFDGHLYEIRILTVAEPWRSREVGPLLMYAALRWVESHGGTRVMALGRREVFDMYLRAGMKPVGLTVQSGAVSFEVLTATVDELRENAERFESALRRLE
ncbi:MAG: GNAT family N-acetyltransferase, partial [Candidatus Sumerlaeota bacterium]|nr:GNAT family N-acetyltransferase [Candidatus Sumerlaeota bacterium]